ncbi:Fur family transcriptional regulator, partial [Enterococcus faecium]|uniref:Fur family transcriptional regulator n=1 Tax=Enterococcus faecium TaxID=1352 RepID=UPI003CC54CC5
PRQRDIVPAVKSVDKVRVNDGLARYDVRKEGAKHFHHQLLCLNCGTIEEVEDHLLLEVDQVVEERYHFLVNDHRLSFHGICQDCYEKEKSNQSV